MSTDTTIDESLKGKNVINAHGEKIGVVSGVKNGTPYVDPDPGLTDRLKTALGWDDVDEGDHPLREESIERITDDGVHLRSVTT